MPVRKFKPTSPGRRFITIPGFDEITFAIPGSGVQVITPLLPAMQITDPVLLDGYSQPGSSPNTAPPGSGFTSPLRASACGRRGLRRSVAGGGRCAVHRTLWL